MTNFEKFSMDIASIGFALLKGKPVNCYCISCGECDFWGGGDPTYSCETCNKKRMEWLKAEYREPKISIPDDTALNTKVLVSTNGTKWNKRYYAGKRNGKYYVWNEGRTSWTCEPDEISVWEYMKLYNEEEE